MRNLLAELLNNIRYEDKLRDKELSKCLSQEAKWAFSMILSVKEWPLQNCNSI